MKSKGSIQDVAYAMVLLFTFVIVTIIAFVLQGEFKNAMLTSDKMNSTMTNYVMAKADTAILNLDYLFIFIFAGLAVGISILAFRLNAPPYLFFVSLFIFVIIIMISAQFTNLFEKITGDAWISESASHFSVMSFVMNNYPLFILGLGVLVMISLYIRVKIMGVE